MRQTILRLLDVDVPARLIQEVTSAIVPRHAPATHATALHILRSGACGKLVGPCLATQLNRLILQEIAEVPVDLMTPADLAQGVRRGVGEETRGNPDERSHGAEAMAAERVVGEEGEESHIAEAQAASGFTAPPAPTKAQKEEHE